MIEYNNKEDKQTFTLEKATMIREKLLVQREVIEKNIEILKSIKPKVCGLDSVIQQYVNELDSIDNRIIYWDSHVEQNKTIEIPFKQNEMTAKEYYEFINRCINAYESYENGVKFVLKQEK